MKAVVLVCVRVGVFTRWKRIAHGFAAWAELVKVPCALRGPDDSPRNQRGTRGYSSLHVMFLWRCLMPTDGGTLGVVDYAYRG
jgi:hypothetical protein